MANIREEKASKRSSPASIHDAFKRLRGYLTRLAKRHPEEAKEAEQLRARLEDLEGMCLQRLPASRYGREKHYYRTESVRGQCLAETWEGARQPFLVPKDAYIACANAVARRKALTPYSDIYQDLRRSFPDAADYMLRTCLRFWSNAQNPFVRISHRQYQALTPSRFVSRARRAWDDLPEHPL